VQTFLDTVKETLIKYSIDLNIRKIRLMTEDRYKIYELLGKDESYLVDHQDRIGELLSVDQYIVLQKKILSQVKEGFSGLEERLKFFEM
jgi:hypothetical protein